MQFFDTYTSNTAAGSANQFLFSLPRGVRRTGRVFYRIDAPGTYRYALLFSNVIDSTYADGLQCRCNVICDPWQIHSARVGKCPGMDLSTPMETQVMAQAGAGAIAVSDFLPLTFGGQQEKNVMPGEFFHTDPVELCFAAGEYLCVELTFSGSRIPYHEESILPIYTNDGDGWRYDRRMPLPAMVGCDRPVAAKIGYAGDSITQGIGTQPNAYLHWSALLGEKLGQQYAHWNLGIGYGRAHDMASLGAWYRKAVENDILVVCYGVNDIMRGFAREQICADLARIVTALKQQGKTVVLQTVPPFSYEGEKIETWHSVNRYIREELAKAVDLVFDNVPILGQSAPLTHMARYGGHPDATGCAVWAQALYAAMIPLLSGGKD